MSSTKDTDSICVNGHCYCGAIEYTVTMAADESPLFPPCYCHCESCRRAHAAPLYHVVCIDGATQFQLTKGEEHLKKYQKPNTPSGITRCFCDVCGSKILNEFNPKLPFWPSGVTQPMVFFPDTLDKEFQGENLPQMFQPKRHNEKEESVLNMELLSKLESVAAEEEEEEPEWKK